MKGKCNVFIGIIAGIYVLLIFHLDLLPNQQIFSSVNTKPGLIPRRDDRPFVDLLVVIGSGSTAQNEDLRLAARETFLKDLVNHSKFRAAYRFFVDANASRPDEAYNGTTGDTVEMDVPAGYAHFADRAFWQMEYAANYFDFQYLLRIDDDGYICTDQLIYHLMHQAPKTRFFWGKYWCGDGQQLADENFMLFSRDILDIFFSLKKHAIQGENATFAALFGFWNRLLNLTIWDDRDRIDAQQEYTTTYMHSTTTTEISVDDTVLKDFCKRHIFAHHVRLPSLIRRVHSLLPPETRHPDASSSLLKSPTPGVICRGERNFSNILNPERTSLKGLDYPAMSWSEIENEKQMMPQFLQ
jgi:hypothetical protein